MEVKHMKKRTSTNQTGPSTFPNEPLIKEPANEAWERIALKAYELYEQRGRAEGHALDDWLTAESIVRKHD
jgi:hypothetical protein